MSVRTGYVTTTDNHEQVFVAVQEDGALLVSRDHAKHWIHSFIPRKKANEQLSQYIVLGVDDGAIYINARSEYSQEHNNVGDLYVSANQVRLFFVSFV